MKFATPHGWLSEAPPPLESWSLELYENELRQHVQSFREYRSDSRAATTTAAASITIRVHSFKPSSPMLSLIIGEHMSI